MKLTLPEFVRKILDRFQKAGFEIYIIGGAVRDLIQDKEIDDWDFTTNAKPEEILKLFPEGFYDNKFGTVGIADTSSPNPYEITTFRREIGYSDRRHPDRIEWGKTLEEDLARRDFTINAMALRLVSLAQGKPSGELIDPYNGQRDLKDKLIRAVGDPILRFNEDALRMMRAVRIATELGFLIEENTFEAIKTQANLINHIAKERIRDELLKILASQHPYEGFVMLRNSGLLKEILPELERGFGVEQKSPGRHHIYDVGTHLLLSLRHCPSGDPLVRFATLIHDIGKPQTARIDKKTEVITFYNHEVVGASIATNIAQRLHFSKKQKEKLVKLVRWHQFTVDERQTDTAIRRFIRNVGKEDIDDMLDLRVGDRLGGGARETSWRLEKFKARIADVQKQPFSVKDLKVTGHDVMKTLKVGEGPLVGKILTQLFNEIVLDQKRNKKDYLLQRIKEIGAQLRTSSL